MNVSANKIGFRTRAAALCAGLLATLGLSGLTGPASPAAPAPLAAAANGPLTVDLGTPTGAFRGGASGSLYGISADGVPSDNLIQGMGLQTTDTKAQDGQQHPGSDALEIVEPFLRNGGRDLFVYMTDQYRDFPYERKSYAEYQGYMRAQVEQARTSPDRNRIVFVPYNEPDINWFSGLTGNATTRAAYQDEWLQTYRLIKGIWPQARIAGPNLTGYYPTAFNSFFTFCKANGCLPDVVTWHYALSVPAPVRSDVAAYRALERQLGIGPLPVNLNEYGARYQLTNPAQMVGWLSALEDAKVDGDMSYWNINGTLSDSTAQQNVPNAQWWLYNWYSQLSGQSVAVTPSPGDTMQGLATLDPATRQARVVVGGGPPGTSDVVVKHVDPALFGSTVHATVERDRWTGVVGAAAQPVRVSDTDVPVGADGSITVPIVDDTDQVVTGACDATGARVPGRLDSALRLCGNNEYAQLPQGIVSGLTDFTISTWVNPSANTQWSRLFDFGSGPNTNMFVTMNDGTNLRFAITTGGGGAEQRINANGVLPLNTWSHVAVTLSGNTGTLYVNGQAVGTNPNMTLHPSSLGSTTQNYIGKSQYNDPYLNGMVDDFQIYGHALSASDIGALAAGQPGSGDVADYRFDEASGTGATDSSGNGQDATIVSAPQRAPSTSAYQIVLSPGGTGSSSPVDATWTQGYEAEAATLTGSGWNINTEGTPGNLGGFATSDNQDVGGLRTGSSTVITFHTEVPRAGNYDLAIVDGSYPHASDVSGPTNVFVRVDGGAPREVDLPLGYEWPVWTHADTSLHLDAGKHDISLSTVGADGAVTNGDAIIDKIDLRLLGSPATVYEAEQSALRGAAVDYRRQGQSGAGSVDLRPGQSATFWVYSARDGYSDLSFRTKLAGLAQVTVNGVPATAVPHGTDHGWLDVGARPYLGAGVNKVVVTGAAGRVTLDELTVTPASGPATTYPAEDGTLTGTAHVDTGYSQAHAGVVTGVGGGPANSLTFHVHAARPGRYAMTVRFANGEELTATHYNPDVMTAPADISVNGGPTTHVNFGNTFHWNQFWNLTIPVQLRAGTNTIRFVANPQYNYDGTTVGVVYSGSGPIGAAMRSDTAPNIDEITIARWQ